MAALIGLFVGAFVGHMLWRDWGAALGGVAGFIIGAKLNALRKPTRAGRGTPSSGPAPAPRVALDVPTERERALLLRIGELELRVAHLEARADTATAEPPITPQAAAAPTGDAPMPAELRVAATIDSPVETKVSVPVAESRPAPAVDATPPLREAPAMPGVNPIWTWFTGGNALTRIGVVVLFFGVAFLLRYFAEHFAFPIELRLAAVAACGFALIALGGWLARSRPGYGVSLEGAGAGILYLTTFAAFRLYGVLPEMPALLLLVLVSAASVWLAVRNDSQPLAALAIAGGFLAPMLVAEGGEPVQLFSYFAVLNGAIFALAWTRAWRALNAVGFGFTFVLAALWGHGFYRPEHYAVVQPFLVLFFGFYVTIAILYARRGPIAAKDPVDALLVFGVPIVGLRVAGGDRPRCALRRRVERHRDGRLLPGPVRGAAPSQRARRCVARTRLPRAGGRLRHDRRSVRLRSPRNRRAVGGRGSRRVLDRHPAARAARARVSRSQSSWVPASSLRRPVWRAGVIRSSPTHSSPARS